MCSGRGKNRQSAHQGDTVRQNATVSRQYRKEQEPSEQLARRMQSDIQKAVVV